jgi:hypothetical protein
LNSKGEGMKHLILFIIVGILLSPPAWGQMYRYKDSSGTVRFTDNLTDVPEKQREAIIVQENTPDLTGDSNNTKLHEKAVIDATRSDSDETEEISDNSSRIDRFLKIKTALDEENAQFTKESLALSDEVKTLSGKAAINAYNEKVSALNARVDDYEKRRAAFQKEADAFDAALKKRLAPVPPSPKTSTP